MATSKAQPTFPQASTQLRRQVLMESLRKRAQLAYRTGDVPAQQALYREATALELPLDCLNP